MQVEDSDISIHSGSSNNDASIVDESRRIDSFLRYPLPHNVNVIQLARHGFYYSEPSPRSQKVVCLGCGKEVESWNLGDEPSDPQFHDGNCRFLQGSEHGSMVSNVAESLVRASVQSTEELTKPHETAGTSSNNPAENMHQEQPIAAQSLVPVKQKESAVPMPYRQSASLPPERTTYEITHIQKVEGKEKVTNVRHLRATREEPRNRRQPMVAETQTSLFSGVQPSYHSGISQPGHLQRQPSVQESSSSFLDIPPNTSFQPISNISSHPENPNSVEEVLDNLNMRIAENRLYTFQQYWGDENEFRNYRLLVKYGFYCLGQGDAVECFCCHLVAANWDRNDNPRQRHMDMSPYCRFIRGEDSGDVPLLPETRRNAPASAMAQRPPSAQGHNSNHSSPYQSLGQNPVAHPSPERAVTSQQESLLQPSPALIERNNLYLEFPCQNPANPTMREERVRLQTLNNPDFRRNTRLRASNEAVAAAGMYYLGDGDRCKCWFCDGGLMDFQADDDPWVEHAKYFPQCEFLLQQKGPAWVTSISVLNPNIQRPIFPQRENRVLPNVVSSPTPLPPEPVPLDRIEDPQQQLQMRDRMLQEGMQSEPVETARQMGFDDGRIKDAQMRKILRSNCCYQTSESLIDALLNPNGEPDSPEPAGQGNAIDLSGQTIHIRGGNFVGPSIINGRIYRQTPPDGSYGVGRRPRANIITINGRTMDEIMAEAFGDPFFGNGMDYYEPPAPSAPVTFHNSGATIGTGSFNATRSTSPNPQPQNVPPLPRSPSSSALGEGASSNAPSEGASSSSAATNATPEERLEEMERERRCKVCYSAPADILFQPCGHICACTSCSNRLNSCPVCRRRISRYIRTYHA